MRSDEKIHIMSNLIDVHIGKRLRRRREKLNFNQKELGEFIGVSYQQIQKYERGDSKIPSSRLYQIAQILRVSIEYFYENIDLKDVSLKPDGHLSIDRSAPLNILLVEDDPTDQMLTRNALAECNSKTNLYIIQDGEYAIEFLQNRIDEDFPRPDIILLDLNIPKRDGFEVLKELKRNRNLQDIPVIILTNSSNPEHITNGYKKQISGYISKSFDIDIFNRNIAITVDYWSLVSVLPSMQNH